MSQVLDVFTLLFITMGPLKVGVVFAGIAAKLNPRESRRLAIKAVIIASIIGFLFIIGGKYIEELFHFSTSVLLIAGGIILLIFGVQLVLSSGENHFSINTDDEEEHDLAIYPLAVPLIASPMGIVVLTTISVGFGSDILHNYPVSYFICTRNAD